MRSSQEDEVEATEEAFEPMPVVSGKVKVRFVRNDSPFQKGQVVEVSQAEVSKFCDRQGVAERV